MDAPDKVFGLATTTTTTSDHYSFSPSYTAPPLATQRPRQHAPSTVMDLDSHSTEDRTRRAASVLSMDDLEAAQALEGLRSGGYSRVHRRDQAWSSLCVLLFIGRGRAWERGKWISRLIPFFPQNTDNHLEHQGKLCPVRRRTLLRQNHCCRC